MNHHKKHTGKQLPPMKKLVYFLTLTGFTTSSLAASFPITPLHLQDEVTTVTPAGVKPNIMLFIDDSGSMMFSSITVKENNRDVKRSRMYIVQKALNDVLVKYKDSVNWGYQTLHGTKRTNLNYYYNNNANNWYEGVPLSELKNWGLGIDSTSYCTNNISGNTNYINGNYTSNQTDSRKYFTNDYQTIRKYVACTGKDNWNTPTTTRYTAITNEMLKLDNLKNRCQKSYVVLLSDGDASSGQEDLKKYSRPLFENDQKTSGTDIFGGSWQDILYPKQNIVTYTVGFGSGLSAVGKRYLIEGASDCPDNNCPRYSYSYNQKTYTGTDKLFYTAEQPEDLVQAFDSIFTNIENENKTEGQKVYSATAPAISSNYIDGMAAAASLNTASWSSELLFYNVGSDGRLDMNRIMRPSFNNRQLLISDGANVHLYSETMTSFNNQFFGIQDASGTSQNGRRIDNKNEWKDGLLKWMARADTDENIQRQKDINPTLQLDYRIRPAADEVNKITNQRSMGDIIDNSILAVGSFDKDTKRQEFVVTSTNDGMVYVFKSQNDNNHPYDLKFNYAPAKMDREGNDNHVGKYYQKPTLNDYGSSNKDNPHHYLLNGGMVARTTDANGKGKQIFMASTMGQAGRGAFAINIGGVNRQTGQSIAANNLSTSNWHQDVQLFETPKGADNDFGFTIGSPQIGRIQYKPNSNVTQNNVEDNVYYGVFVANGYQYAENETPALYVYDALGQDVGLTPSAQSTSNKGNLLKKIQISNGEGGLASPTLVDANFDGVIDYAYAGDYGGNLYRFNLKNPNPSQWSATKIFQTPDNQPITSAPAVYRNSANKYTVMVGTGSEIYQEDLTKTDRQAIYGIFDDLTVNQYAQPITSSDLLEQELSTETLRVNNQSYEMRKSTNRVIEEQHKGWYVKLDAQNGERITVKPSVMGNTLLLASRIYSVTKEGNTENQNQDPCLMQTSTSRSDAYSWLMQFNTTNGGLIPATRDSVFIDFNLDTAAQFKTNDAQGNSQAYLFSGQKLGSLTSITLIDRLVEGYSHSTSGDAGGSGEDAILNPNPVIPRNTCVGDDSKAFTFNTDGQSETYHIHGACRTQNVAYKRISWREIF